MDYRVPDPNVPSREDLAEYIKLKERYDALQRTQRNLLGGEDLGPLSTKKLESLERQLDSSLKQIRTLRNKPSDVLDNFTPQIRRRMDVLLDIQKGGGKVPAAYRPF